MVNLGRIAAFSFLFLLTHSVKIFLRHVRLALLSSSEFLLQMCYDSHFIIIASTSFSFRKYSSFFSFAVCAADESFLGSVVGAGTGGGGTAAGGAPLEGAAGTAGVGTGGVEGAGSAGGVKAEEAATLGCGGAGGVTTGGIGAGMAGVGGTFDEVEDGGCGGGGLTPGGAGGGGLATGGGGGAVCGARPSDASILVSEDDASACDGESLSGAIRPPPFCFIASKLSERLSPVGRRFFSLTGRPFVSPSRPPDSSTTHNGE